MSLFYRAIKPFTDLSEHESRLLAIVQKQTAKNKKSIYEKKRYLSKRVLKPQGGPRAPKRMVKNGDMVGDTFGKLTAVSFSRTQGAYSYYIWLCTCGKTDERHYWLVKKAGELAACRYCLAVGRTHPRLIYV